MLLGRWGVEPGAAVARRRGCGRSGDGVEELVELAALGDDGRAAGLLGVLDVGGHQPGELGLAVDVALDQVDVVGVVDRDVADRHAPVDALRHHGARALGDLIASELALFAGGGHRSACPLCAQRALAPYPRVSERRWRTLSPAPACRSAWTAR